MKRVIFVQKKVFRLRFENVFRFKFKNVFFILLLKKNYQTKENFSFDNFFTLDDFNFNIYNLYKKICNPLQRIFP